MSLNTTSKGFLTTSRDDSTTTLGSLFQCLTTLSVKKFFLISNLNILWQYHDNHIISIPAVSFCKTLNGIAVSKMKHSFPILSLYGTSWKEDWKMSNWSWKKDTELATPSPPHCFCWVTNGVVATSLFILTQCSPTSPLEERLQEKQRVIFLAI